MSRIPKVALSIALTAALPSIFAQAPAPTPAQTTKAPARPQPPTRDPHTPGYVTAKEGESTQMFMAPSRAPAAPPPPRPGQ